MAQSPRFPKIKKILQRVYYNPKTGYGRVQALYRQVRKHRITLAQVRDWVKEQDTYTLHKPIRRKFKRHRTKVTDIDEQWQLDLADVSKLKKDNNGYTFYCVPSTCYPNMPGWSPSIRKREKK
jgi:hypothetical protein